MIVVITPITRGRLDHLALQQAALAEWAPEARQVLVVMDDAVVDHDWVVRVDGAAGAAGEGLPLARARNAGADAAIAHGASVLIFLDVDCIPGQGLVAHYADAVAKYDVLTCGMVTYLEPAPDGGYDLHSLVAKPHEARPALRELELAYASADEYRLFWSLSFALSPGRWREIGGFCEEYEGYGAEDTDFGFTTRAAGVPMLWLGGADAFHQHHPVSDPPWEHLADITRNANLFHRRWGEWPMEGWLGQFADAGAIQWDDDEIRLADSAG